MTTGPDDRGSGTVLVVALAAVVIMLAGLGAAIGSAVVARHRAETAADLAALAAVSVGCGRAEQIAAHDGSVVAGCRVLADGSVVVDVAVPVAVSLPAVPRTARARARAGLDDEAAPVTSGR